MILRFHEVSAFDESQTVQKAIGASNSYRIRKYRNGDVVVTVRDSETGRLVYRQYFDSTDAAVTACVALEQDGVQG